MGKKQHQKDKLYLTTTEWKYLYGGHKDDRSTRLQRAQFKRLPFTHCSLSLQPFEDPVCTDDGTVFDLSFIVPWLKKKGINPVTGEKLDPKALIQLNYQKNASGDYHCPVTYKVFTKNSHIVAISTSGNVYSYEAVEQLNLKPNHMKDLLTDQPFTRANIIHLQDPNHLDKFNIERFKHIKLDWKTVDEEEADREARKDPQYFLKKVNIDTRHILEQLKKDYKAPQKEASSSKKSDSVNAAHYSTGMVAAGFTSTTMEPITEHEAAIVDEDTLRYARVKKKGYVRMVTSMGPLNLELHCELTPKAAENFTRHCANGYYDGTKFHRIIRNFIAQGGDPTGTGKGGVSIWGEKGFKDEIKPQLRHDIRGVLSMANSGSDTNGSQFFITFRSCKHLDGKHTIFGRVVGGMDTLTAIERTPTEDYTDKPLEDVKILSCQVFVDPFSEADEQLKKERESIVTKQKEEARKAKIQQHMSADPKDRKVYRSGVGKYIKPQLDGQKTVKKARIDIGGSSGTTTEAEKKTKLIKKDLSDFSAW